MPNVVSDTKTVAEPIRDIPVAAQSVASQVQSPGTSRIGIEVAPDVYVEIEFSVPAIDHPFAVVTAAIADVIDARLLPLSSKEALRAQVQTVYPEEEDGFFEDESSDVE